MRRAALVRTFRTIQTVTVACLLAVPGLPVAAQPSSASGNGPSRELEPVVVEGSRLSELEGEAITSFGLFRYDASENEFLPILFQIDERVDHVFNEGYPVEEFTQNIHDVFGEDDGILDADDELVFLFRDAGPIAPPEAPWPDGAEEVRYELEITDPATPDPAPTRWVYLFHGTGLPIRPGSELYWDQQLDTSISSTLYSLDFTEKWILEGFRVFAPCGDGTDLLDRFKVRVGASIVQSETEERWNNTSLFLGGIVGPVRAIRYVRGAASGYNTIHHDLVYPDVWERNFAVRVHPLKNIWFYLDYRPASGLTYFSQAAPQGVAVDGQSEWVGFSFQPWTLVRGPSGGLVSLYRVPPSPSYDALWNYYLDDASFDDASIYEPSYTDEDNSAYGNHGFRMVSPSPGYQDPIEIHLRFFPLCSGIGNAPMGAEYLQQWNVPLVTTPTPQWRALGPVRSLTARGEGQDVVLQWDLVTDAISYNVYAGEYPSLDHELWDQLGQTVGHEFTDAGAMGGPIRFYSVVPVGEQGEGEW